jgi:hypothetical protein
MTTGPDGRHIPVAQRLADIRARYSPDDPVGRAIARSAPLLNGAVLRVTRKLTASQRAQERKAPLVGVRVMAAATI